MVNNLAKECKIACFSQRVRSNKHILTFRKLFILIYSLTLKFQLSDLLIEN